MHFPVTGHKNDCHSNPLCLVTDTEAHVLLCAETCIPEYNLGSMELSSFISFSQQTIDIGRAGFIKLLFNRDKILIFIP